MTLTMLPAITPVRSRSLPLPTKLLTHRYHHSVLCDCGAQARYRVPIMTISATGKPIHDHLNLCPACYLSFQEQEPTMPPDPITQMLPVDLIRLDGGTQMRARINMDTVAQYADDMAAGDKFPAIHVVQDVDGVYWCADGEHRVLAHKMVYPESSAVVPPIEAVVHDGTRRDAMLYAATANKTHGLPRTNADKRHAVEQFLRDEEWGKLSDREVAQMAGVSHPYVAKVRADLTGNGYQSLGNPVRVGADGRTIDTTNIGRTPPAKLKRAHTAAEPKPATVVYVPPADGGHALDAPPENGYAPKAKLTPDELWDDYERSSREELAAMGIATDTAAPQALQATGSTAAAPTPPSASVVVVPNVPLTTGPSYDLAARREHIRQLRAVYQAARESIRAYEEATGDFDSGLPLGRVLSGMVATLDHYAAVLAPEALEESRP